MKKILKNIQLLDILNKFKVIVKTHKMLKTTILGFIIAILSKLGIYNKATKPILDKFGEWTAYLYRFWMLFNFFLALYFIGMIGPWEVITYIKNMLNSITEFYINLTQSFIDYIKHIFGGAPEAATKGGRSHTSHTASGGGATERIRIPLPDWRGGNTPGGGGGGATSSGDVGGEPFFSLRRLYALKESFNAATSYYDNVMSAVFNNNDTLKTLFYGILLASTIFAIWYNMDSIINLYHTTYNICGNIINTTYNYVLSIPNRIFNAVSYFYACTLDYFNLLPPDNTHRLPRPAPRLPPAPSTNTEASVPEAVEFTADLVERRAASIPLPPDSPNAWASELPASGTAGGGAMPLNPENVAGPSVGRSHAPSIFSRKSSYNPAAVGLSLTNSQIGGGATVLPNWPDALDNFSIWNIT